MKKLFLLSVITCCFYFSNAQTFGEVLERAYNFRQKWNYDSTMYYMQFATDRNPNDRILEYTYATYLADFCHYREALVKFSDLMKHRSKLPYSYLDYLILSYVDCYLCLDSIDRGFEILNSEISDNPRLTGLLNSGGHRYYSAGNLTEAMNCFKKSYAIDSTDTWVVYFIGEVLYVMGDTAQAAYYFNRTIELEKTDKSYPMAPYAYVLSGQPDRAVKEMKKLVAKKVHPKISLAAIYGMAGMKQECIDVLLDCKEEFELGDYYYIMHNRDYNCIRSEPQYIELINELKEK